MRQRWLARALVAGLHIGLLAALWLYEPAGLGEHRDERLTTVRLIPAPPPRVPPPPATPRREAPLRRDDIAFIPPPRISVDSQPPADTAPSPAVTPPAAATVPGEPPRTTLRLSLPPGYAASSAAARNPALGDPRSNTARRTLEDRIADAAGVTGEWVMERTSDHRTLMRRGDTCMEMFRSRIADTDPFNNNVAPRTVPMYGQPYKCK